MKRADEGDYLWTSVLLHWSSADPLIHLPLHLPTFLSEHWAQQAPAFPLHSVPFKKPLVAPFIPALGIPGNLCNQSSIWGLLNLNLVYRVVWSFRVLFVFWRGMMYYVTLYSPFKFCRTEFSLYHPLHGRHFLAHHLGDCVRLLETLQKVPALLSLSIVLDRSKASHNKSHCSCKKGLCTWNVRRSKFHRSDGKQRQKQLIILKRTVFYTFRL